MNELNNKIHNIFHRFVGSRPDIEKAFNKAIQALITEQVRLGREKYDELIMAVGNKYEGESRHETALRYIQQAEHQDNPPTKDTTLLEGDTDE